MPRDAARPVRIGCPRPARVRVAGPADEDAIYDCLMALDEDNGYGIAISPDRVRLHIREGTQKQGAIIGVIDGPDGQIIASVAVAIRQYWYSDEWYLQEGWLFVRPEYRRGVSLYRDLFAFAKWYRAEIEQMWGRPIFLFTNVWSFKRLPLKLRLWARFGKAVGGIFKID